MIGMGGGESSRPKIKRWKEKKVMREFIRMDCLLALALLLAGCAPAPKTKEIPLLEANISVDENAQASKDFRDKANELHAQIMKRVAERNDDTRLLAEECLKVTYALKRAQDRIAALKDRVAELEGQQIQPPTWVDVRDLQSGAISVRVSGEKRITIHHDGGSWCNVWADDKGIHWEECK